MKFHQLIAAGLAWVALAALAGPGMTATEEVTATKEFMIFRDFREFRLRRFTKVFFDDAKIYVGRDPKENAAHTEKLREQATASLRQVLDLVGTEQGSQYTLSIRMIERTNYAIRNAERKPSLGHVSFALCMYPPGKYEDSCQNLTYEFFQRYERSAVFDKVLNMWAERVVVR